MFGERMRVVRIRSLFVHTVKLNAASKCTVRKRTLKTQKRILCTGTYCKCLLELFHLFAKTEDAFSSNQSSCAHRCTPLQHFEFYDIFQHLVRLVGPLETRVQNGDSDVESASSGRPGLQTYDTNSDFVFDSRLRWVSTFLSSDSKYTQHFGSRGYVVDLSGRHCTLSFKYWENVSSVIWSQSKAEVTWAPLHIGATRCCAARMPSLQLPNTSSCHVAIILHHGKYIIMRRWGWLKPRSVSHGISHVIP